MTTTLFDETFESAVFDLFEQDKAEGLCDWSKFSSEKLYTASLREKPLTSPV